MVHTPGRWSAGTAAKLCETRVRIPLGTPPNKEPRESGLSLFWEHNSQLLWGQFSVRVKGPPMFVRCLIALSLLSLSACTQEAAVRTRAANDLQCNEDKIEISDIGGNAYRARGCGGEATYACTGGAGTQTPSVTCTREAQ
jgi:hypothetical protein